MTGVRYIAALGVVIALGLGTLAGGSADDLKAMQGEWLAKIVEIEGKPTPPEFAKIKVTVIVKDNTYRVLFEDKLASAGTLKLDASKKPHTMDATNTEGPNKGKVEKAIYKITGDKMIAAFAKPGKDRPTEFKTTEGSGHSIIQYERIKK